MMGDLIPDKVDHESNLKLAREFVHEQAKGEWGPEVEEADAQRLALLLDKLVAVPITGAIRMMKGYVASLHNEADKAYCQALDAFRKPECLGWEAKIKAGQFGRAEFESHKRANELMGRHHGIALAVTIFNDVCKQPPRPEIDNDWREWISNPQASEGQRDEARRRLAKLERLERKAPDEGA